MVQNWYVIIPKKKTFENVNIVISVQSEDGCVSFIVNCIFSLTLEIGGCCQTCFSVDKDW